MDIEIFDKAKDYAERMRDGHGSRISNAVKYRKMYELNSDIKAQIESVGDHVKFVCDPSPRVRTQGAKRLMTATEMAFKIPRAKGVESEEEIDMLEEAAQTMWWRSGLANGAPLEEDMVLSALLYDEVHVQVHKTADMVAHFEKGVETQRKLDKSFEPAPAAKERIERLAESTPYLFEVVNVEGGFPEWDNLGLRRYLSIRTVTRGYLMDMYGVSCDSPHEEVSLYDMWDLEWRHIWIAEEEGVLILQEKHGLPFIPIVCYIVEGSRRLWNKPDAQRQPFLYTMDKGGLWDMNTIWLSAMATNVKEHGLTAQYVYTGKDGPAYQQTGYMGVFKVQPDESLEPIELPINGDALQNMYALTSDLTTQSTLYTQALGQPLGGSNRTYSETALLHQAGRLPLVTVQRQVANCASEVMWLAFRWMQSEPGDYSAQGKMRAIEIEKNSIPEFLVVEATLEIDLPQDQLQMMNVATQATELMGREWTIENVVSEPQPKNVMKQKASEDVFQAKLAQYFQKMQWEFQKQQMVEQQQIQQQQQMQQQMLQQQQMAAQQAQMGDMAGGGMMPGNGQPMSPEEEEALLQAQQTGQMMPQPDMNPRPSPGQPEAY